MDFVPLLGAHEWDWMKARAHMITCEDSRGIVAYDDKNRIAACCVFDSFTADSCNVHIAIDNPLVIRSGFLKEIFRYLFVESGRKRIFGFIPANNEKSLNFSKHVGWVEDKRITNGFATGIDYVVLCMEKADCRWIEELREAA
jgi:hypothetical protein